MSKKKISKLLEKYRSEHGLIKDVPCTQEENERYATLIGQGKELPEGVYAYDDFPEQFYTIDEEEMTEAEIKELIGYKKLGILNGIRKCLVFFVVLTVVSLVLSIISVAASCSAIL